MACFSRSCAGGIFEFGIFSNVRGGVGGTDAVAVAVVGGGLLLSASINANIVARAHGRRLLRKRAGESATIAR